MASAVSLQIQAMDDDQSHKGWHPVYGLTLGFAHMAIGFGLDPYFGPKIVNQLHEMDELITRFDRGPIGKAWRNGMWPMDDESDDECKNEEDSSLDDEI